MREDVQNRIEMLDSIISSLKGYPNFGGEVGVLKEVERLRKEARIEALEWVSQDSTVSYEQIEDEIARLNQEIVRLRNEGDLCR